MYARDPLSPETTVTNKALKSSNLHINVGIKGPQMGHMMATVVVLSGIAMRCREAVVR
jgi:hypothetical protein